MQLEQTFFLPASLASVWAAFHQVELLVDCLPGASLRGTEVAAEVGQDVPLMFKVKLGPIAAGFAGQGVLTLDEDAKTGVFAGTAVDAKTNSRVKGEAAFALTAENEGTRVSLGVTYTVTGALAQFSREGIMRALADQLSQQFAQNLQQRLPQASPEPAAAHAVAAGAVSEPVPTQAHTAAADGRSAASSIDIWMVIKLWLKGLFAKKA